MLAVGRSLWLNPFTHSEWLETTKVEIYHRSFRHDLIKNNFAIEKNDHLEMLYSLCTSAGLNLPAVTDEPSKIFNF